MRDDMLASCRTAHDACDAPGLLLLCAVHASALRRRRRAGGPPIAGTGVLQTGGGGPVR